MYLEHFGLTVSPFGISPRLDFLYKSGAFAESMAHLVYGVDSSEAIVMITGAIGTGKTMAVQSFLAHLGDRYMTALVTNTNVSSRELLKLILDDLGAPLEPSADKSDLLIAFKKFLIDAGRERRRIIIVIDEAQNLAREVLEEIRQLTNLGQGSEQPVQVVLVGQPELEASVARPDLAQLKQRIRIHYKLAPLSRREVEEYVDHRMVVAGGERGVFGTRALDRIYELSAGVPRVVNTLCSEALLSAFVAGRRKVEAGDVGEETAAAAAIEAQRDVSAPAPAAMPAPVRPDAVAPTAAPPPPARPASAPRAPDVMAVDGRSGMAVRRGHGAGGAASRARRRSGFAWTAVLLAVAAIAALALTGRLDFLRETAAEVAGAPQASSTTAGGDASTLTGDRMDAAPAVLAAADTTDTARPAVADTARVALADTAPQPPSAASGAGGLSAFVPATSSPAVAAPAVDRPGDTGTAAPPVGARPAGNNPADAASARAAGGQHYLHVTSFRTADQADAEAAGFTARGLPAFVRTQTVRGVLWHRVCLGPYGTHDDAVRLANRLRDEGTITYYKIIPVGAGEGQ